ncbi:MAG: response regulator [Pleurocapsa sp. MO_226.B13]|nr:response regulator [Pleurocapsa sp. MO_226.B13]
MGKGTTIRFEIEVDEAKNITLPKYPTRQVTQIAPDTTIPKILVVEDKWESRELLVKLLESVGFEVKAVANGLQGVNLWREWQPRLIWMDIQMPVMNGYEAIAKIRKEEAQLSPPKSKPTVIVALTASVFKEDREKIIAVGGDEVVHKPFADKHSFW